MGDLERVLLGRARLRCLTRSSGVDIVAGGSGEDDGNGRWGLDRQLYLKGEGIFGLAGAVDFRVDGLQSLEFRVAGVIELRVHDNAVSNECSWSGG